MQEKRTALVGRSMGSGSGWAAGGGWFYEGGSTDHYADVWMCKRCAGVQDRAAILVCGCFAALAIGFFGALVLALLLVVGIH
jgi:hypothetical protein